MKKRVVVTGGAGFIGSHLCEALLNIGEEVICVDNFVSGSRQNIEHLLNNPMFTLIEHDVTRALPSTITNLDAIFHFASPASPNPDSEVSYIAHPIETLMVNTLGTRNMLELATVNNCQIILASTSEIYGDPLEHPQNEAYWGNVSPNGERSCYDEGKRALEAFAFAYFRTHKTKIKVLRIFNTYGPNMRLDDGRFIPTLISSILKNEKFVRFGNGQATRSFCYIDDLVSGIMAAYKAEQAVGQVINLGNPSEYSVNQVIEIVETVTSNKLKVEERPPLPDDPARRRPDISRAKKLLGWQPKIELKQGLQKMLESYE